MQCHKISRSQYILTHTLLTVDCIENLVLKYLNSKMCFESAIMCAFLTLVRLLVKIDQALMISRFGGQ